MEWCGMMRVSGGGAEWERELLIKMRGPSYPNSQPCYSPFLPSLHKAGWFLQNIYFNRLFPATNTIHPNPLWQKALPPFY